MNKWQKVFCLVVVIIGAPLLYVVSYVLLVDRYTPSLNEHGRPTYRSSYPRITSSSRWNRPHSWYFPDVCFANRFFLPIDQQWRLWKGLPPSTIQNEDGFWQEYFQYLVKVGVLRERTTTPNEVAPSTEPETTSPPR